MFLFQPNVNPEKEMPAVVQTVSNAKKEKETVMLIHSVLETLFVAQIIVDCGIQMLEMTLTVVKVEQQLQWQLVMTLFDHNSSRPHPDFLQHHLMPTDIDFPDILRRRTGMQPNQPVRD